jgi:hypothetical protein
MNGIVDPFTDGIKVKYPDIMFYFWLKWLL